MPLSLHLPSGWATCSLRFTGTALPTGAAITFQVNHQPSGGAPVDTGNAILTAWNAHIDSTIAADVTLADIHVKYGPIEDGPFAVVAANSVGSDTAGADSPNVALLVRKNTTMGGRKGMGRMYVPGLGQTRVTNAGVVQASDLTVRETAWDNFHNALSTAGIPMALAHSAGTYVNKAGETVTLPEINPSTVTGLTVQGTAATQRRRLRR